MFTSEEIGRLSAVGFYQNEYLLPGSPIEGVDTFLLDRQWDLPAFERPIPSKTVLGKRTERYMHHYLQSHPDFDIIGDQVQVIHEKETIGEFDFFLKDLRTAELIHLEMAYKLYLYLPEEPASDQWVGPNRRDMLSKKLEKMKMLQFPLLRDQRVRPVLDELGIDPQRCKQALSMQGQAYVPRGYAGAVKGVRNEAVVGTWCRLGEFVNENDYGNHYHFCTKDEWIIDPMYNRDWHLKQVVLKEIEASLSNQKAPMVWSLHPDGSTSRTFIVWW